MPPTNCPEALVSRKSAPSLGRCCHSYNEWTQTGSNRRPPRCQRGALPAELWAREEMKCSFEFEVTRPVDAISLIVQRCLKSQSQRGAVHGEFMRYPIRGARLVAPRGNPVNFVGGVHTTAVGIGPSRRRTTGHFYRTTHHPRPFALNAIETTAVIEDQVVRAIDKRPGHCDTKAKSAGSNCSLSRSALLIRRQHVGGIGETSHKNDRNRR